MVARSVWIMIGGGMNSRPVLLKRIITKLKSDNGNTNKRDVKWMRSSHCPACVNIISVRQLKRKWSVTLLFMYTGMKGVFLFISVQYLNKWICSHCFGIPSVISTFDRIHATHILAAFGSIDAPHSQQMIRPGDSAWSWSASIPFYKPILLAHWQRRWFYWNEYLFVYKRKSKRLIHFIQLREWMH